MTTLRWLYRVMFGIAWTSGAITGTARWLGDLTLEQSAPGYSLCTAAFMAGASFYAVLWALGGHRVDRPS